MWEDNNPLSYERRDSISSAGASADPYQNPLSPSFQPIDPDNQNLQHAHLYSNANKDTEANRSEEDDDDDVEDLAARRERGFTSRVEQILFENKDLTIYITDAGKSHEGGGNYIVYTIRTGDLEVRRRYSEFESLRKNLALLHPTLIVPPIPDKHSLSDYATAPRSAKEDVNTIDLRKRMLSVFLNRCSRMKEVRADTIFSRFLDPNASWSEVLSSPPVSTLPKNHLRAPPLDPSNPSPAHAFLPIPSASAKLRPAAAAPPQTATPNRLEDARFPKASSNLTESELDPYFNQFESTTREFEALLSGSIEKVNRRILKRLGELGTDYAELGARYNAFSLSESGPLAAAIERIGQAVDSSYIATEELARVLSSGFAEPLRESAQFASIVQGVLKYRVMKRLQEEMTRDQLEQKRRLLEELEESEQQAKRVEQYLHSTMGKPENDRDDVDSINSEDFPPTHGEATSPVPPPATSPKRSVSTRQTNSPAAGGSGHKKSLSYGGTVAGSFPTKLFGRLSHAVHGIVDVDPETTRRNNIGKTRENIVQLESALKAAEKDVKDTSAGVLKDLKRFQREKEDDLRRMMIVYAKCHIEWAKKNLETWEEAKSEVDKIVLK